MIVFRLNEKTNDEFQLQTEENLTKIREYFQSESMKIYSSNSITSKFALRVSNGTS